MSRRKRNKKSRTVQNQNPPAPRIAPAQAGKRPSNRTRIRSIAKVIVGLFTIAGIVATIWMVIQAQQGVKEQKQANDRLAGRIETKAEIVELIPELKSRELKPFVNTINPAIKDTQGNPIDFVTFENLHDLCRVNPRLRIKNTGTEIIDSVQIHVQELKVLPVSKNGWYVNSALSSALNAPTVPIEFTPHLDSTKTENCLFQEKFKPGDEAEIPLWRALLRAIPGGTSLQELWKRAFLQGA